MKNREHFYQLNIKWTGNRGTGTSSYGAYDRAHIISGNLKQNIEASSDKAFRGDMSKYSPEELLVASLSSCHMLWFLHLCADSGIVVVDYSDHPVGKMIETPDGGGLFSEVILYPAVTVSNLSMVSRLDEMHHIAHERCFIANSVNFTVKFNPTSKIII